MTSSGTMVVRYSYDAWGNILSITGTLANSLGKNNPFRYRSYYYDNETGWYYLKSRYYDPAICRFISPDSQLFAGSGADGLNLYAYCGNNPVNRFDSAGEAWYHWAIGAAVVIGCAAATVITCGGFAAGAMAVGMVASGGAAFSTASTVAATAFIGSATAFGTAALTAASYSDSIEEFCEYGSWWTVAETVGASLFYGISGYLSSKISSPLSEKTPPKQSSDSQSIGKPFDPKGSKVQIGVDPRTLTPSKDLGTLDPHRLRNAEIYGRDQAISVYRNGLIEDGNHRLANALANKRAIDVIIFP